MKIEDILAALPSREDLASTIGLETQPTTTGGMLPAFGIFGTGIILGAGLALLFAPKAGQEIRQDIAEKVSEIGESWHVTAPETVPSTNGSDV